MRGAKVTYSLPGHMTQSSTARNIICTSLAAQTFTGNSENEGILLVSAHLAAEVSGEEAGGLRQ